MIYILEKYLAYYLILFKLILLIPFYNICFIHIVCIDRSNFYFCQFYLLDPEFQESFECFSGTHIIFFCLSLLST